MTYNDNLPLVYWQNLDNVTIDYGSSAQTVLTVCSGFSWAFDKLKLQNRLWNLVRTNHREASQTLEYWDATTENYIKNYRRTVDS